MVDLHVLSAKDVIISTGIKDCFFPNGSSSFGPSDEMEFSISNFQQQCRVVPMIVWMLYGLLTMDELKGAGYFPCSFCIAF